MSRPIVRTLPGALGLALVLAASARAQVPRPMVPDVNSRSGVITRMSPTVTPGLPYDPDRDKWYDTYYGDRPKPAMRNLYCIGGLYGKPLIDPCPKCHWPYYQGSPGGGGGGHECQPVPKTARLLENFVHPYKPVCYYYAGGCYTPVYDLDPVVTGPGPFPWPWFKWRHNGG